MANDIYEGDCILRNGGMEAREYYQMDLVKPTKEDLVNETFLARQIST